MLKIINSAKRELLVADMGVVYDYIELIAIDTFKQSYDEYIQTDSIEVYQGGEMVMDEYTADKLIKEAVNEMLRNLK